MEKFQVRTMKKIEKKKQVGIRQWKNMGGTMLGHGKDILKDSGREEEEEERGWNGGRKEGK